MEIPLSLVFGEGYRSWIVDSLGFVSAWPQISLALWGRVKLLWANKAEAQRQAPWLLGYKKNAYIKVAYGEK